MNPECCAAASALRDVSQLLLGGSGSDLYLYPSFTAMVWCVLDAALEYA